MEKEVKIEYKSAERFSIKEFIKKIPPVLIPTKRISIILGSIFFLVIIIGLVAVPWTSIFSISSLSNGFQIKLGLPWTFFAMDMANPEKIPIEFKGFILDFIIYFILAYLIDIFVSYIKERFKKTYPAKLYQTEMDKRNLYQGSYKLKNMPEKDMLRNLNTNIKPVKSKS